MPISLVQSKQLLSFSPLPLAFDSDNTAGNLLIVMALVTNYVPVTNFSYSDTLGNTAEAKTQQYSGICSSILFIVRNCKAGANTVTIRAVDGSGVDNVSMLVAIHEFSGVNTQDQYASATGTGLSQDSGPITTTQDVELLFGYEATSQQTTISPADVTWTTAQSNTNLFLTQYKAVSSTGTYNSVTTATSGKSGVVNWIEEIISFYNAQSVETVQVIEF